MYAKLFTSIYQGTLRGNSHGLLVFTNLLAHCDKTGVCDMHPKAIAEEVGLSVDQVRVALDELEAPDIESRSPEEDGRRIIRLDAHRAWGWQVVNYLKYRSIRDEDDRREQNRLSQERWRNKHKPASADVITSQPAKPESAHTEGDLEVEAKAEAIPGGKPPDPQQAPSTGLASGKPARKRASKPTAQTGDVWAAYAQAYKERYQVEPVRNAKVNGQLAQLIARLGADESPGVARAYLDNRNGLYVASKHCVDLLLRDAEKLRTEWATGNVTHRGDAAQADRLGSVGNQAARVTAILNNLGPK